MAHDHVHSHTHAHGDTGAIRMAFLLNLGFTLLEFLGGIDELNEDSGEGGFQDYLANTDIDKAAERKESAAKEGEK